MVYSSSSCVVLVSGGSESRHRAPVGHFLPPFWLWPYFLNFLGCAVMRVIGGGYDEVTACTEYRSFLLPSATPSPFPVPFRFVEKGL